MKLRFILWTRIYEWFTSEREDQDGGKSQTKWMVLLIVTVCIATLLSPFASRKPDGLQRVAADSGFAQKSQHLASWSPIAHYQIQGLHLGRGLMVGLVGMIGAFVLFMALYAIASRLELKGRQKSGGQREDEKRYRR